MDLNNLGLYPPVDESIDYSIEDGLWRRGAEIMGWEALFWVIGLPRPGLASAKHGAKE